MHRPHSGTTQSGSHGILGAGGNVEYIGVIDDLVGPPLVRKSRSGPDGSSCVAEIINGSSRVASYANGNCGVP